MAGLIRNQKIIDDADIILAIRKPNSRGTLDSIRKAKQKNKILYDFVI